MEITTLVIITGLSVVVGGSIVWIIAVLNLRKPQHLLAMKEQELEVLNEKYNDLEQSSIALKKNFAQLQIIKGEVDRETSALKSNEQANSKEIKRLLSLSEELATNQKAQNIIITETKESLASYKEANNQINSQLDQITTTKNALRASEKQNQQEISKLKAEIAEFTSTQKERDVSHKREMERFIEQSELLKTEFENISNKLFDEKSKKLSETNKSEIDVLLKPFKEQIAGFQKRVNEVHSESIKNTSSLDAEIKKVLEVGLKMSEEATNLTTALKGDSQQRGAWGEAQLERTLEMSGLVEDAHYEKQPTYKDARGKSKKPDYVVKLPDEKHIIIDSKVSLNAYDRAIAADTTEEANIALNEHAAAVKARINELAEKDYTNLIGVSSPSFVLMFIPIEPAYIDALKHAKDLFGYGYERNIVLVSHTTLIPILRTVANLWMMERSNSDAKEISDKAGDIFNTVCTVAERLKKLGNTLNTVSTHYNSTVKAIAGQQGLHGKVERFNQLSSKVSKKMPELDTKHIDYEAEKLELIVEPIIEEETDESLLQYDDQGNEIKT